MLSKKLLSAVLDADQLKRFIEHWERNGKKDDELESLLREYEGRVLADKSLTPEQREEKREKEGKEARYLLDGKMVTSDEYETAYMTEVMGLTDEEVTRMQKKKPTPQEKRELTQKVAEVLKRTLDALKA